MTLEPRYPHVAAQAGHYESIYLVANSPGEPVAVWIRYTVHKPPNAAPTASVWFTLFAPDGPIAGKVTTDDVRSDATYLLAVGGFGSVRSDGAVGTISAHGVDVAWQSRFEDGKDELLHLPYSWMYRAPIPRTKATSPHPAMRVSGTVTIGDRTLELDGWRGMLGHNWGAEHAHRWIWLRGASFAEQPDAWLDVVIGRLKIGPVVVPWIANGVLSLDGARHRIGGLGRRVTVHERSDGCDLVLPGKQLSLMVQVTAPLAASVGWEYDDPAGGQHQVRNCSVAGVNVEVRRRNRAITRLTTEHGGVYELGTAEFDPAIIVAPYPDG